MAKKGYRTCKNCKDAFLKEEMHQINSSTFMCNACFNKVGAEMKDYKLLVGYVCMIFKLEKPTGLLLNQIKKFHNEGFTYAGIASTLDFYVNVENRKLDKPSLGFVPYYYENARQHQLLKSKAQQSVTEVERLKAQIVRTKQRSDNRMKRTRFIDISKL